MKIRKNKQGQLEVQLKPKERFSLLYHRLDNGQYEQYVRQGDKNITLNKRQLAQVKRYIKEMEVDDEKQRIS